MEAEDRKLLTDIHGIVSGLKPMIDVHSRSLHGLDTRTRALEIGQGAHAVKIERLQTDLDGVGRKMRSRTDLPSIRKEGDIGFWKATFEFLTALPAVWHVLILGGGYVVTAAFVLWHNWPHK